MADAVIHTNVKGDEIDRFTRERLLPVIDGQPLDLVAASMLSIIAFSMVPDLTPEQVAQVVQNTASYLITELSAITGDDDEVVN